MFSQASLSMEQLRLTTGQAYFLASIGSSFLLTNTWFRRMLATAANPSLRTVRNLPPTAKALNQKVHFGINPSDPEQFRGHNAMNPPVLRDDPYFWLRDSERKNTEVLNHLQAENDYAEKGLAHLQGFREELYAEMVSHLQETDEDVPYRHGDYLYYSKTIKGLAYKIHCRRSVHASASDTKSEEVILDENLVAKGHEYSDVGAWEPSPSHKMLAYSVDNSGYETYTIRIISDLTTKALAPDVIEGTSGAIVWANDDAAFFYLTLDEEHRPNKVFLHVLGTPQSDDICLLTEDDGRFWMHVTKTADDRFLLLGASSKETTEMYFLDLQGLNGAASYRDTATISARLTCLSPRRQGLRYEDIEHQAGYFYIVTNKDDCVNNKLVRVPVAAYAQSSDSSETSIDFTQLWEDVRAYNGSEQIDNILAFQSHLVVEGRRQGMAALWIVPVDVQTQRLGNWEPLVFPEETYSAWLSDNYCFESTTLRVGYSSFLTPRQILDYDLTRKTFVVLKEQTVPGYDRSLYECRRMEAKSRDGVTCIPMSLVYHKQLLNAQSHYTVDEATGQRRWDLSRPENVLYRAPVLLYGYGSYGYPIDPTFDFKRLALLDRGVVYVIAHIRGGGEMGRSWYEPAGKYLHKMNTFHDFADCAKRLIAQQITTPAQLACVGRSAGGLLVGATINMYPSLFKVAVADVPFVDVANTMSDPSIPLTVTEWEEWGNPNEREFHEYMLRYSPYDNVKKQAYPALLCTAGLHDPRVPYWEPAKLVAKLRTVHRELQAEGRSEDVRPLYLKTDLSSGHFSASDRYKYIKETAFEYAFILDQLQAQKKLC